MHIHHFPNNLASFKTRFSDVLEKMLVADELGAFILVLANSMQDKALQAQLTPSLKRKFKQLQHSFNNENLQAAKDDYDVFSALVSLGIDKLPVWKYRQALPWRLVYNPMRSLRPARSSGEMITVLQRPFNPDGFHFNKPFLEAEIFWEGESNQVAVRIFYNKFPFAPYHLLIVPDFSQCLPQFLTRKYHLFIWNFVKEHSENLTGLAVAFNSLGAYASINQLHFQSFIEEKLLPIENDVWVHNGGTISYPVDCYKADNSTKAWEFIESLHQLPQAYNLLYRGGCCYIVSRKFQGEEILPDWVQGIAWSETCGVQTLGDQTLFDRLTQEDVMSFLSSNRAY